MSILQYKVSATVIDSIVFVFALFVFMVVLLSLSCYRFSVNNDLYIIIRGFTFLIPAHLGSPGKRAVKRVCVCVCNTCD